MPSVSLPLAGPRVVIADPSAAVRELYKTQVFGGCDVVEAADGRDALVKALTRPPALMLMEFQLRFVDAVSLCQILRRDRVTTTTPIMVVTNDLAPGNVKRAIAAGVDVVLPKHTHLDVLRAEMRRLLERRQQNSAKRAAVGRQPDSATTAPDDLRAGERSSGDQRSSASLPTLTPPWSPVQPPTLRCPRCNQTLEYLTSYIGGVSVHQEEQWDLFECEICGARFRYRHGTGHLRHVSE
jgi:CheY-like chemotaxis protein